ncbi:MAG: DUF1673 domain-containing protein [Methanomicrobiales archaeon]|nr:DUF1673 domain-containing protein [Methanomicrobiales archaeon]
MNLSNEVMAISSNGGDLPAEKYGWLQRFRNWILLQALFYTAFIPVFMPLFVTGAYLSVFMVGMIIATLAFVVSAHRLWRQYNDVLAQGYREESGTKRTVILYLVIATVSLLVCFEILIFVGFISGIDFLILPALMIGFSIIPWYVLLLVIIWESKTGCRLYFDRKGEHVSMFVVREH